MLHRPVESALDYGHSVTLVSDAIGSRKAFNRDVAISRLSKAGAEVATVEMIAFEWLRSSPHPQFREILSFVK